MILGTAAVAEEEKPTGDFSVAALSGYYGGGMNCAATSWWSSPP
jgi:hypothetical protein